MDAQRSPGLLAVTISDDGPGFGGSEAELTELARELEPKLLQDPSLEYGFLLHDVTRRPFFPSGPWTRAAG